MRTEANKTSPLMQVINEHFDSLLIMAIIIVFVASYFLLIKPKYDTTIIAIKDNISQQEKLYSEQKSRLESLKTAAALYEEIKLKQLGDVRKVNAVLPNEYVKERLFGEMEEIINKSGFMLSSVNISSEVAAKDSPNSAGAVGQTLPKGVGRLSVSVSIGAIDYAGLKNLLFTLENNNRLLDVENVSFDLGAKTASLEMYTYYFKPSL